MCTAVFSSSSSSSSSLSLYYYYYFIIILFVSFSAGHGISYSIISLTPGFIRSLSSCLSRSLSLSLSLYIVRYAHFTHSTLFVPPPPFLCFFSFFVFLPTKRNKEKDKNTRFNTFRFLSSFVIRWPSKMPVQMMIKRNDVLIFLIFLN